MELYADHALALLKDQAEGSFHPLALLFFRLAWLIQLRKLRQTLRGQRGDRREQMARTTARMEFTEVAGHWSRT